MKVLLTNDDGIEADGLRALLAAVGGLGEPVVVAPFGPQSGVSHAVTTGGPVRIDARGGHFAVHGTPADCVRVGLYRLCPDAGLVLSGVNHGGNLGADVYYSGTVAAVREAVLHGWPGIALSHYRKRGMAFDWPRAGRWVARVLADLLANPPGPGSFYNVNLPHLRADEPDPEVVFSPSTRTRCRSATGTRTMAGCTTPATTTPANGRPGPMSASAVGSRSRRSSCSDLLRNHRISGTEPGRPTRLGTGASSALG